MRYLATENHLAEPFSGYPVEGWNDEPGKGLCLRSFTQLTAIGEWIETLANVVAGHADTPYLSREQALTQLDLVVDTLRHDQKDSQLAAKGLLVNFLDLSSGRRLAPLVNDVDRAMFLEAFGGEKGEAVWRALKAKGWIVPRGDGSQADIRRSADYGLRFFNGPLAPLADEVTKRRIMEILDRRVLTVVFGDNANLSISVARAQGVLLRPELAGNAKIRAIRTTLEHFLDDQQEGYAHLYDARAGMFSFGWDASRDQFLGWQDEQGNWRKGYMDYLGNEFRGPTNFVVLRFGLPIHAVQNLGFKIKPYRIRGESDTYVLAPWDGSAFQALGLGLCMGELQDPSWKKMLGNLVDVELDFAARNRLPGFLSESYTGDGAQYTGAVGIPDIAVTPLPRITSAPRSTRWESPTWLRRTRSSSSSRITGRQYRNCSPTTAPGKASTWPGKSPSACKPPPIPSPWSSACSAPGRKICGGISTPRASRTLGRGLQAGRERRLLVRGDPRFRLGRQGGRHDLHAEPRRLPREMPPHGRARHRLRRVPGIGRESLRRNLVPPLPVRRVPGPSGDLLQAGPRRRPAAADDPQRVVHPLCRHGRPARGSLRHSSHHPRPLGSQGSRYRLGAEGADRPCHHAIDVHAQPPLGPRPN